MIFNTWWYFATWH